MTYDNVVKMSLLWAVYPNNEACMQFESFNLGYLCHFSWFHLAVIVPEWTAGILRGFNTCVSGETVDSTNGVQMEPIHAGPRGLDEMYISIGKCSSSLRRCTHSCLSAVCAVTDVNPVSQAQRTWSVTDHMLISAETVLN